MVTAVPRKRPADAEQPLSPSSSSSADDQHLKDEKLRASIMDEVNRKFDMLLAALNSKATVEPPAPVTTTDNDVDVEADGPDDTPAERVRSLPKFTLPRAKCAATLPLHFRTCEKILTECGVAERRHNEFRIKDAFVHRATSMLAESLVDLKGAHEAFSTLIYRSACSYATAAADVCHTFASRGTIVQAAKNKLDGIAFSAENVDDFLTKVREVRASFASVGGSIIYDETTVRSTVFRKLPLKIIEQALAILENTYPGMDGDEILVAAPFDDILDIVRRVSKRSAFTERLNQAAGIDNVAAVAEPARPEPQRSEPRFPTHGGGVRQSLSDWARSFAAVYVANAADDASAEGIRKSLDAAEVKLINSRNEGRLAFIAFSNAAKAVAAVDKADASLKLRSFEFRDKTSQSKSSFRHGGAQRGMHRRD
jgi:hypothetical protein